jgi:putative multiple sugar transport system ATP-binding protein
MNVLSGIYPYGSYEGDIIFQGAECRFTPSRTANAWGSSSSTRNWRWYPT